MTVNRLIDALAALRIPVLITVALLLAAVPARAQEPDMARARAAFAEGKKLFEEQKPAQAASAFREAYRLSPSWKIFYNIGQCEAAAKRYGLALEAFERYLAEGGDEVDAARRDEVLAEVERLRKMVGTVSISAPDGAVVFVEGVERGVAPLSGKLPVSAGIEHVAWVVLDGMKGPERKFKIMGSDSIDLALAGAGQGASATEAGTTAEPAEPGPAEFPERSPSSGLWIGGWVMVGAGAAMLITGGITGGMALNLDEDLYGSCPEEHCPATSDYQDKIDRLDRLSVVTDVMLFAGGAIAATGAVLLILDATRDEEPAVSLAPALGPDFAGAALRGRF
ncbi:MAG TPA: tetratricopeptide repeat protein [Polyangia bacterium]|nr:tetratricopeptide repeat protein [Polyangia bacterium]